MISSLVRLGAIGAVLIIAIPTATSSALEVTSNSLSQSIFVLI